MSISVTIPQPCTQDWEQMQPADRGRFCASCAKTVIDFSLMTDSQILEVFKKAGDRPPCGHFHTSQLNRTLIANEKPDLFRRYLPGKIAASLLLFQTFVSGAWAQTTKPKTHTVVPKKNQTPQPRTIDGSVIDIETGEALRGLVVSVADLNLRDITNAQGCFRFTLPANCPDSITITVSYGPETPAPQGTMIERKTVRVGDFTSCSKLRIYRYRTPAFEPKNVDSLRTDSLIRYMAGAHSVGMFVSNPKPAHRTFKQRFMGIFKNKHKNQEP